MHVLVILLFLSVKMDAQICNCNQRDIASLLVMQNMVSAETSDQIRNLHVTVNDAVKTISKQLEETTIRIDQLNLTLGSIQTSIEMIKQILEKPKRCAVGWVQFKESCYLFWNQRKTTFQEAVSTCQQFDAHVVFVESQEENNFLKSQLQLFPGKLCYLVGHDTGKGLFGAFWWIGMTDEETEDVWKWYGTDIQVSFTDWSPSEPNYGRGENCCSYYDINREWYDIACGQSHWTIFTICEKQSQ